MAQPASRSSDQILMRLAVGIIAAFVLWVTIGWLISAIATLVRIALLLGLLGVVAWFVLVGPRGSDERP